MALDFLKLLACPLTSSDLPLLCLQMHLCISKSGNMKQLKTKPGTECNSCTTSVCHVQLSLLECIYKQPYMWMLIIK